MVVNKSSSPQGVEDATAITVTSSKKEGKTEKAFH
jgi:hypothetical protein